MKKYIFLILLTILLLLFLLPIFLPKQVVVEDKKVVNHSIALVFEQFNNLKKYSEWNHPNASNDSLFEQEFFAPYKGEGAAYAWQENNQKNKNIGTIDVVEAVQNTKIVYQFLEGEEKKASNIVVDFKELSGNKTEVNYTYASYPMDYFKRLAIFFIPNQIKAEIGNKLSALAQNIKITEASELTNTTLQPNQIVLTNYVGQKLFAIRNRTVNNQEEIEIATAESLAKIKSFLFDEKELNPEDVGYPTIYWRLKNPENNQMEFLCAYPISQSIDFPKEEFELFASPNGRVLAALHLGSRDSLDVTYKKMMEFATLNGLQTKPNNWEVFLDDTGESNPLKTIAYIAVEEE